jgi:integrase
MPKKGIGIYQRKNGMWEGQHYVGTDPLSGKRKKVTCYGRTEKEAKEKLIAIKSEIKAGVYIEKNKLTVKDWFTQWLEVYATPNVKQSTFVNYRIHINKRIIPILGAIKLNDVRVDMLQRFFNEQYEHGGLKNKGPLSEKTIRNLYVMIHTAFKQAYQNGLILKNSVELVKIPKVKQKEMRVLSIDEHRSLFEAIKTSDERWKTAILLAVSTGIRMGEVLGLQWQDVDEANMLIKIRRTLNRLPSRDTSVHKTEIVIGYPKSDKSVRDIPIHEFLMAYLNEYREKREVEKIAAGDIYDSRGFIFCNEIGNPIEPRTMQDTFKRIVKEAKIADTNFHALRHTFATRAIEDNMEIKTLSEILGHADVGTTLNKYAHSLPDQKRKMMTSMAKFYE